MRQALVTILALSAVIAGNLVFSGCSLATHNAALASGRQATTAAPSSGIESGTLTVLAASSMTEAFAEIGLVFESRHPGVKVEFSTAGSQQLAHQLAQGAPADVFASASIKYMQAAVASGRVADDAAIIFAKNKLVVIFPKENPGGIKKLKDLSKPGLKIDLAAKEVPAGEYSLDFLEKAALDAGLGAAFKAGVLNNVVSYEESVKAVLAKISFGEADAGIVYLSDVSQAVSAGVGVLEIPAALNVIASYPIAVIQDSQKPDLAQAFVNLVLSNVGQAILAKNRFIPVQ